jgi:SAM-dependent methyltransferase
MYCRSGIVLGRDSHGKPVSTFKTVTMCNHNDYYHDFLLRQCPANARRALDVGCGLGQLSKKLAGMVPAVDALDADASTLKFAIAENPAPNIRFIQEDFLTSNLSENSYDFVIAVASLHHMDIRVALSKMRSLASPGGVIAILGLYRESTFADYIYCAISLPWSLACRIRFGATSETHQVIILPPNHTLREIRATAEAILPGCLLRRQLLWRYSLYWCKERDETP